MPLRPKTKRRLTLLAAVAVIGTSATAAVVSVRLKHQQTRRLQFRADGLNAYHDHNYPAAADKLTKYLGNDQMDPEALLALAISKGNLPRPDQSHLINEQKDLNRYLELNPSDDDARHTLLDVSKRLNDWFDTDAVAAQILAHSPDNVEALTAQLAALKAEGKLEAALAVALHLDQIQPLNCRVEGTTLDLMNRLGRPPVDGLALVERLATDHPDDPRVDLLRAVTDSFSGDVKKAQQDLLTAAAKPSPDDDFTLLLADYLDGNALFTQATNLLTAADSHRDIALTAYSARRLFHAGQLDAALTRLGPVTADTPSQLICIRTMVLANSPKPEDRTQVATVMTSLSARPDDSAASCVALMPVVLNNPPLTPRERIKRCLAAGLLDADSPDIRFYLGHAYQDLGENELAIRSYNEARDIDPAWAGAELAVATLLLEQDRAADAAPHAQRAVERDPSNADAAALSALIQYRRLPAGAPVDQLTVVLNSVHETRTDRPDDPRLAAAEVDLLARTGDFKAATAAATAILDAPLVTPAMLSKISAVASADKLDIGPEIQARALQLKPIDPPSAYDRAIAIAVAGDPAAGRRALDADTGPGPAWAIVVLQYRDATNNPASPDAWAAVADANPGDLAVQRAVLRSPTATASRPLIERTVDRLHALTGDEAIDWKLAHARWMLSAPGETREEADAVAASMNELVKVAPLYAQPLVVWADALQKAGDVNAAIDRLKNAVKLEPEDPDISLRLARLLSRQGQTHDLGELLDHIASAGHLSPAAVIDAANLLDRAGQRKRAIDLLDRSPHTSASELLRARLTAAIDPVDADRLYGSFAKSSDPQLIEAAARRVAAGGDVVGGRAVLARLDSLLPASDAAIAHGNFESDLGQNADAVSSFTAAIAASPGDPKPWRAWAQSALRHRDWDTVVDVANRGLHQVPKDAPLTQLAISANQFKAIDAGPELSSLIDAASADPTDPATVATVAAAGSAAGLNTVVSQYPTYWPARATLVRRLMEVGHYQDAADVASVAANQDPTDAVPAELLTSIWATAGRWENARTSAVNWKSRIPADTRPADLAIAVADLRLDRGSEAVDLLTPYLAAAQDAVDRSPDASSGSAVILDTICRALVATGRTDRAANLLLTPATKSAAWRRRWLRIIADEADNPASAGPQIDRAEAIMPPGSVEERLAVADTWYRLADRFNDTPSATRALEVLDPLTDTGHPTVDVYVLLGAVQQQLGDLTAAETADRAALSLAPNLPAVQNNLAQVILLRNEDSTAAEALARQAVNAHPTSAAAHETLGQALARQSKFDEATRQFTTAIDFDPDNIPALLGLAEVQQKTNQPDRAAATLRQAKTALTEGRHHYPDTVRARLDELVQAQPAVK